MKTNPRAFTHCPDCAFEYRLKLAVKAACNDAAKEPRMLHDLPPTA